MPQLNLDNHTTCVKVKNEILKVYCVECNEWRIVALLGQADTLTNQLNSTRLIQKKPGFFCCSACHANIEYLLSEVDKGFLRNKFRGWF